MTLTRPTLALLAALTGACSSRERSAMSGFVDAPTATLSFPIAGRVEAVAAHEGDEVKKDQVLARLDAHERTAQVALAEAEANDADSPRNRAALGLARAQLAEATLTSPFDGHVVTRNLEEGEWAAPGAPVLTVERTGQEWVRVDVEETRLGGLKLGQTAQISVVALPGRSFNGHVSEIGAEADFAVNRDVKRGRPDVRTFRVRVAFDHPPDSVRPGMTAEVHWDGTAEGQP